ncbi:M3 family oligoendopeptidase [Candidatus Azambacteria bacterium]|nr:M3 family oligoendopeptidase [Candidatus Azambacteria bacterium]
MNWDLSDIYRSIDDKKIPSDVKRLKKQVLAFEKKYKGKVESGNLSDSLFLNIISEYENILMNAQKPYIYFNLLFCADSTNAKVASLMQKMEEEYVSITKHLLFFDLELAKIPDQKIGKFIRSKKLKKYFHHIKHIHENKKYNLSELEEKIIQEMTTVGRSAFTRLFDQIHSKKQYQAKISGKNKSLNQSEIISLLHNPKRDVRKAGAEAFTEGLKSEIFYNTFIYNTLLNDSKVADSLRKYAYPEQSRHIAEETDRKVVDMLSNLISEKYGIVSRYYSLKRKALKLEKLYDHDRYAPLSQKSRLVNFKEAEKIVLESFSEFSETMADIARKFFENKWIDAKMKKGKRGGAFCMYVSPDIHPYILTNYSGSLRDVMTLAHEIGHGIHAILAKDRGFLSFSSSLALAETASVFGEMLVFNKEMQKAKTDKEKFLLLAGKIEDIIATVFRQNCMYLFEKDVHKKRREEGELTEENFNEIWQKRNKEMFGKSVELTENYKVWWSYISHFMHSPFYVYTYSFGELLTLALYKMYKKEGKSFEKKYLNILSKGSSESPEKILKDIGVDINKKEFWKNGLLMIEDMVLEAERLYKKIQKL